MHYAILTSTGNALEWFTDEAEARRALAQMLSEAPDADLDLVAFEGSGRPVEPVSPSARSAWPAARLVWSNQGDVVSHNAGNVLVINAKVIATDDDEEHVLGERADSTDDRVTPLS